MRIRLLSHLFVLAVMLLVFAPDALAVSSHDIGASGRRPATAAPTGGAALTHQLAAPIAVPAAPRGATESAATTQTIVQIQVAACSSHCSGTTETQAAQQQAVTVQAVVHAGSSGTPKHPVRAPAGSGAPRHAVHVTRGQIGCLAHCFGTTTRRLKLGGHRRTLRRLLHALLGSQPLMRASAADPSQTTVHEPSQSRTTVHQASLQRQYGSRSLKTLRQRSSQASITIQRVRLSRLIRNLQSALITSAAPVAAAVSETVQTIWQLQIGCLSYCSHTRQDQQAEQTSTTIQLAPLASAAAAQDNTAQSIWQLQVGCLVWCFSATEQQRANSRHVTLSRMTAASPAGRWQPGSAQLDSTVASQSGGSGVTIVARSSRAVGVSALEPNSERPRHSHVRVAHPAHRNRSRATKPQSPAVRSSTVRAQPGSFKFVLGVVAGLIVLLATITASRIAARHGGR